MKRTDVVTSFLLNEGRILILKRSDKVRTNKGKWAGISGYLNEGEEPLERALIEISEEAGLNRSELKLVKVGKPLETPDNESGVIWVVHPFLFMIGDLTIRLDWEHDEYLWIKPDEIESYLTVPMLKETLLRVTP